MSLREVFLLLWLAGASPGLLGAGETSAPAGVVATIGDERVASDETFQDNVPSNPRYTPERACKLVVARVREALVRRVLRQVKRLPSDEEISRSLQGHLPSPEALEKHYASLKSTQDALEDALNRSESDPTRDHEIWQTSVSQYMSYEKWVEYRTRLRGQHRGVPFPAKVSSAELLESARGLRGLVVEESFQRWLQADWARQNPGEAAPAEEGRVPTPDDGRSSSASLQLRFWRLELIATAVTILPEWHCSQVQPADLIAPQVQWPEVSK